jgi:hypothetical protein
MTPRSSFPLDVDPLQEHELLIDAARMQTLRLALHAAGLDDGLSRMSDHEVVAAAQAFSVNATQARPRLLPLAPLRRAEKPAGKPLMVSQLVPRRTENHWVQFHVVDAKGEPVSGVPYRLLDIAGGPLEKDTVPISGKVRRDGVEVGTYTFQLGELQSAQWLVDGRAAQGPLPAGVALTLAVQTRHVPPGTSARFKIFHLYDEEPGHAVGTAEGKVGGDGEISVPFTCVVGADELGRELTLIYSCTVGKLWIKSRPLTLALPRLTRPRWGADELTVGDVAALAVDCPGIVDGESVHFKVCRADTGACVAEFDAPVRGGSAQAPWTTVDPDPETPESELYFDASCAGLKTRSRTMRLLDDVELVFQTDDGDALANGRITLEFGDGTRCIFRTDHSGVLRLTDPRARTARVLVADTEDQDVVEQS